MKLTKSQFKRLLKEEITKVFETHGGLERAASLVRAPEDPMARGYQRPPQAMQRLMRVIVDTLKQEGMSDEDVIELTKELLGAGMLQTAEEAPEEVGLEEIIKEELNAAYDRMREVHSGPTEPARWWEYPAKDVMRDIYRQQGQLPPTLGSDAWERQWESIKKQLEKRYPRGKESEDEPVPALEEEIPEKAPESAAWKRRKAMAARQKIVRYLVSKGVYEEHAHLPNWIDVRSGYANVAERELRAAVEAGKFAQEDVNSFMKKLQREIR